MSIPATPVPGTQDPNPLLTAAEYMAYTQDLSTNAEYSVTGAIADATLDLQMYLGRTLVYGQYGISLPNSGIGGERCYVYKNGMVYPSAYPIDEQMPVSTSASTPGNSIHQGRGIWVGWFIPLPSLPVWEGVVPPQTDITYWGGYSGSLSGAAVPGKVGPQIPARLKRCIARVAWFYRNPAALPGLPGGVKSTNVGGVSIAGDLSSFVDRDKQLAQTLARFKNRLGKHWDN